MLIICDIDGTVCKRIDRSPYHYDAAIHDVPNEPIIDILKLYYKDGFHEIVFVSGRPESARKVTREWLDIHFSSDKYSYLLYMRQDGDYRADAIIKREIYINQIESKPVLFVLDDRNQTVRMWRELGLTCLQVAEGNF
jgi:hypothetical protein